jgi:DNA-binding PadR family transcriptional regulator
MHNRELLKGTLTAIVLKLLATEGKMYGYEIAQRVKQLSGEKILLKDGSLYPALHKLTKDGLLQFEEQHIGKRVRKYYYLTTAGTEQEKVESEQLKEFMRTLKKVLFPDFTFQLS